MSDASETCSGKDGRDRGGCYCAWAVDSRSRTDAGWERRGIQGPLGVYNLNTQSAVVCVRRVRPRTSRILSSPTSCATPAASALSQRGRIPSDQLFSSAEPRQASQSTIPLFTDSGRKWRPGTNGRCSRRTRHGRIQLQNCAPDDGMCAQSGRDRAKMRPHPLAPPRCQQALVHAVRPGESLPTFELAAVVASRDDLGPCRVMTLGESVVLFASPATGVESRDAEGLEGEADIP